MSVSDFVAYRLQVEAKGRTSELSIDLLESTPDWERFLVHVDRASREFVRLRQRLVVPSLPVATASWATDPDFDLGYHVRRFVLPRESDILQVASTILSTPLDPDRPLWETTLVEGTDGGLGAAVIWKFSPALFLGTSSGHLDESLYGHWADPDFDPLPPLPAPMDLTASDLSRAALPRLPITIGTGTFRQVRRILRNPLSTTNAAVRLGQNGIRAIRPTADHQSPLLRRRSRERRFAFIDVPVADVEALAGANDCPTTAVHLAALAGALEHLHDFGGAPIDSIAVSIPARRSNPNVGPVRHGGQDNVVLLPLPKVAEENQLRAVNDALRHPRENPLTAVVRALGAAATLVPDQALEAIQAVTPTPDVVYEETGRVTGPRYIAGSLAKATIPVGPLGSSALAVRTEQMDGRWWIGVVADVAAVPDLDEFIATLRSNYTALLAPPATRRTRK